MANPADIGTFDLWITNRIGFVVAPPKSGDTGDFDRWITDRIHFRDYAEAEAPLPPPDEKLPDKIKIIRSNQLPIHQLQL